MSACEQIPVVLSGVVGDICPRSSGRRRVPGNLSRGFTILELTVVVVIIASVAALVVANLDGVANDAELTVTRANLNSIREAIIGSAAAPGMLADMKYVPGFKPTEHLIYLNNLLVKDPAYPGYDITTNRGWRGPYLKSFSGGQNADSLRQGLFPTADDRREAGDPTFFERGFFFDTVNSFYGVPVDHLIIGDAWGNPIVLQIPPDDAFVTPTEAKRWRYARLVSAGPDGVLSTPRYDASVLSIPNRQCQARLAGMLPDGDLSARVDDLVLFLNRVDVYEAEEP